MSTIRPNFPPPATTARPVRPDVRAAQKAFFQASVTAAAPTAARPEPVRAAAPAARTATQPEPEPQRYLRPGSLLDIKV